MVNSMRGGRHWLRAAIVMMTAAMLSHTVAAQSPAAQSTWQRVTRHAAYPTGYNYPVYVAQGRMWAMHAEGVWSSADGRDWRKEALPSLRRNVYQSQYVMLDGALFALGDNRGNYESMRYRPTIRRTRDFRTWETLSTRSNLPARIFFGAAAFKGKLWLFGGFDGKRYHDDVWRSGDGVTWTRVVANAGWSPRSQPMAVVFRDRVWLVGGGVIDGHPDANPGSAREIWSSPDGVAWARVGSDFPHHSGGAPVVFDGELWLVGANRDGRFGRSSLVSGDGIAWREEPAPWTPRGGVAAWVYDGKLWMTGGKYSVTENGRIRFIYSNDVWKMSPTQGR
jgi:hypothetical protein